MNSPPPSSSDIFMFSPLHETTTGPQDEVEALIATASNVTALSKDLASIINSNKIRFLDVFGRQVQLLKSRSQAFEDAHVTVYDKVLLALTKNGNDLEHPAAITWYCAEYLGINTDGDVTQNTRLVEQALEVPVVLSQALAPATSRNDADTTPPATSPNSEGAHNKDQIEISSRDDPKFNQFWSVYSKARAEYLTIASNRNSKTLEAARFLRDTAENGIHYLQKKHPKDPILDELINTLTTARKAVLSLNGGKKRKFDKYLVDTELLTPHTTEHNREHGERRRRNRGPSGTRSDKEKAKRRHRGRGPSGVPYGYSRPVDSYQPA